MSKTHGLWNRVFGRRAASPPVIDRRCLNEDWRPGDLAVCEFEDWAVPERWNPRRGDLLRVTAVFEAVGCRGSLAYFLRFEGKPDNRSWVCTAFRKVRPIHEPAERWWSAGLKERAAQAVRQGEGR